MDKKPKRFKNVLAGVILIASGVVFNEWVVVEALGAESLPGSLRVLVWPFDFILLYYGIRMTVHSDRSSFSFVTVLSKIFIIMNAVLYVAWLYPDIAFLFTPKKILGIAALIFTPLSVVLLSKLAKDTSDKPLNRKDDVLGNIKIEYTFKKQALFYIVILTIVPLCFFIFSEILVRIGTRILSSLLLGNPLPHPENVMC